MTNKNENSSSKKERNWRRLAREITTEDVEKARELLEKRPKQNNENNTPLKQDGQENK